MFWRFNLLSSHMDTLLEKADVTLFEVLDEDDVLQECKNQNRKLIDFLVRPENMEELVNMVTQEPSDEQDEKMRYKYPNTSCEVLTSDVQEITDKLAGEEALLNKVYSFLESEGTLNPLLASFFSKVMGLLITRKSQLMVEFLRSKEDFVGHLLHHLSTSAIMDLLLRLITCIDSKENRTECINWLNEQNLVLKLVQMIDPSHPDEKHCNAAQSLCDIIRLSRDQMSQLQENADADPLLAAIESRETITELLNHMFSGEKNESVIVNGLSVIQTLLEFKKVGVDYLKTEGMGDQLTALDNERLGSAINNTMQALLPRLKDFHQVLLEPPKQHYSVMPTTIGTLEPPLGNPRLQASRLMSTLLLNNTYSINAELHRLGTIQVLLDLYLKYIWNNFLHTQVESCIFNILSAVPAEATDDNQESPLSLVQQLFTEVRLIQRILEAWDDNEQHQTRPGGHRRGYMGHLTKITNHVVNNAEKGSNSDRVKELIQDLSEETREKWETFVSGTLAEVNKQNTVDLVGNHQFNSSSEDDDADFRDIPFPQDSAMQQAFSDYQLQQMTSNFIDQFGFKEDEFEEQPERADAPFGDKITSINFDINTSEDNPHSASLFEQACNERMHQFDDDDCSDGDLFEQKEFFNFSQGAQNRSSGLGNRRVPDTGVSGHSDDSDGSTDSEEELDSPRRILPMPSTTENMDIDSSTTTTTSTTLPASNTQAEWPETGSTCTPVAMDTASPWESQQPSSTTEPSANWAKFDDVGTTEVEAVEPSTTSNENWADFSSFSNLSSTDPGPDGSTPVAMDIADSSTANNSSLGGRAAAYLVSSAPADLCNEVTSGADSAATDAASEADQTTATTPATSQQPATASDSTVEEPTTSNGIPADCPVMNDVTGTTNSDGVSSSTDSPSQDGDSLPATPPVEEEASPPRRGPPPFLPDDDEDEDDDDLSDNFNFLAGRGLMRGPTETTEKADNSDVSSPDSLDDHEERLDPAKLEEARAEAKAAMEKFTAASGKSATQNGPL